MTVETLRCTREQILQKSEQEEPNTTKQSRPESTARDCVYVTVHVFVHLWTHVHTEARILLRFSHPAFAQAVYDQAFCNGTEDYFERHEVQNEAHVCNMSILAYWCTACTHSNSLAFEFTRQLADMHGKARGHACCCR